MSILVITGTALTQGEHTSPAKTDNSQPVKVSAIRLAVAKAVLSKTSTKEIRINPATADGGI